MGAPYAASHWTTLFGASAGACATLTGLLFVSVSINLEQILRSPGLTERAQLTLVLLMTAVLVSLAALVPGQDRTALGAEVLALGLLAAMLAVRLLRLILPALPDEVPNSLVMTLTSAGMVPLLLGGVSLLAGAGGGLYWIAGGIAGAILGAVSNAWVLLVEIVR